MSSIVICKALRLRSRENRILLTKLKEKNRKDVKKDKGLLRRKRNNKKKKSSRLLNSP